MVLSKTKRISIDLITCGTGQIKKTGMRMGIRFSPLIFLLIAFFFYVIGTSDFLLPLPLPLCC